MMSRSWRWLRARPLALLICAAALPQYLEM